ncbi:class II aldolase/adducin family protein [Myxococcota bacterium]|nr:class II aldolase/adducin family protein [Myxococcota bacterium]
MNKEEKALREELIHHARQINATGLNHGTNGNLSVRFEDGLLITPTGMTYDSLQPEDIVFLDSDAKITGLRKPSSEWPFHYDILKKRPEVQAIIHTHSIFATTLACMHLPIPAFHYMVAVAGGTDIRCADYATFGSEELSLSALRALQDRKACLLANHGMIILGDSVADTFARAIEVETLAQQYWRVRQLGDPIIIDDAEMGRILEKFKTYGQQK